MGCIDNLFIDKVLFEDVIKNVKNILCVWIDVKKVFDSVVYNWFVIVLRDYGVNERFVCFIEKIIKLWKMILIVLIEKGIEKVGLIRI